MIKNTIIHILKYIICKIRFMYFVKFDFSSNISPYSSFEGMSKIHHHCKFKGHLGLGSYIGDNSKLEAKIGRFTSIGPRVSCNLGVHPFHAPYVSSSPCFYSLAKQCGDTFATEQLFNEWPNMNEKGIGIEIGNDCWIGEGVFIVGGVKIGDGAVVLAHAVVTKNVPDYAIVGGVPAKVVGYRYDEETRQFLIESKWWNHDIDWFKKHWRLMSDIEELKQYYKEHEQTE